MQVKVICLTAMQQCAAKRMCTHISIAILVNEQALNMNCYAAMSC
jgi:hypothetical protein